MVEACDFLDKKVDVGETVIMNGGGLTGSKAAYELSLMGKGLSSLK